MPRSSQVALNAGVCRYPLRVRRVFSPLGLLLSLTLLCLLPWVGKAFFIDDPLFVWSARHIVQVPQNPYGFSVNWYGYQQPMAEVFQNPPLTSYYLAVVGSWCGFSEIPLHLAFLLPALAMMAGTYRLAQRFTSQALLAGVIALFCPVFLVSATSVMSDVLMTAWLTWAMLWWLRATERNRPRDYAAAGLLLSLAFLTKYFAILLWPVWLLYALLRRPRGWQWLLAVAIPALAVVGYEVITNRIYGHGLFWSAATYSHNVVKARGSGVYNVLDGFCFCGGCLLPLLFMAPQLWGRSLWKFGAAAVACLLLLSAFARLPVAPNARVGDYSDWLRLPVLLQGFFLIMAGLAVPVFALQPLFKRSQPSPLSPASQPTQGGEVTFLAAWIGVTFVFGVALNWTLSARSILPLVPPSAVVMAMRLEMLQVKGWRLWWPLAPCAIVCLLVLQGDWAMASVQREEARDAAAIALARAHTGWYEGGWGFSFYAQQSGLLPVDFTASAAGAGDAVAAATNTPNVNHLPPAVFTNIFHTTVPVGAWASTMNGNTGAGFYSTIWGPLPYALGQPPAEKWGVWMVRPR